MAKIPKIFRSAITEDFLENKILKRIYINEYRIFLKEKLVYGEDKTCTLKKDLDKKDIKKLKTIAKSIKANTGFVAKSRFILLGIIISVFLIFNLFLMDMIIENAIEETLEPVFRARVDLNKFHLDLLSAGIKFDSLIIANAEKPMNNLFELGFTEIDIDPIQLLKGRVIIESVQCQDIAWDTKREHSGSLPEYPVDASEESESSGNEPDFLEIGLESVEEVIDEEKSNLESLAYIENINNEYQELLDSWQTRREETKNRIGKISESVQRITSVNIRNIDSLQKAKSTLSDLETISGELDSIKDDLSDMRSGLKDDITDLNRRGSEILSIIEKDSEYLSSLFNLGGPSGGGIFNSIIEKYIEKLLGDINTYVLKALALSNSFRPESDKEGKDEQFTGIDIIFPGNKVPAFWLKYMGFSVGRSTEESDFLQAEIKNIASEQDLTGEPISVEFKQKSGSLNIAAEGEIDTRKNAENIIDFELSLEGVPVELGNTNISIEDFKADSSISVNYTQKNNGSIHAIINISLTDIDFSSTPTNNLINSALIDAIKTISVIDIEADYFKGDEVTLKIKSNLDDILHNMISAEIERLEDELSTIINDEINKYISLDMNSLSAISDDFDLLSQAQNDDVKLLDSYTDSINSYKSSLKDKISDLANPAKILDSLPF